LLGLYFTRVEILKIGSASELVKEEITRTKKQRLISLPFTLSIYPYKVRVFMLNLAATLFQLVSRVRSKNISPDDKLAIAENQKVQASSADIIISGDVEQATDLLAICHT
jgi:hypothetical protein